MSGNAKQTLTQRIEDSSDVEKDKESKDDTDGILLRYETAINYLLQTYADIGTNAALEPKI